MQYLKTNLTGSALRMINIQDTVGNEDFNVAWKILQSRFENKRAITNMALDGLLDQPAITNSSAHQLQHSKKT